MERDSLIDDILTFAFLKASEGSYYYWKQAHKCNDISKKTFLLYLAAKKKKQMNYIQRIADEAQGCIQCKKEFKNSFDYLQIYTEQLYTHPVKEIYTISYDYAKKELEFFKFLKILKKNSLHHSVLEALVDIVKDFAFEIKLGYIKLVPAPADFIHLEPIEVMLQKEEVVMDF